MTMNCYAAMAVEGTPQAVVLGKVAAHRTTNPRRFVPSVTGTLSGGYADDFLTVVCRTYDNNALVFRMIP